MVVLIVDDELPIREWMKLTFEKSETANLTVLTASNGQEALEIVRTEPVNIVFADIRMPILGGLDLLKEIKTYSENIYVAILTSYSDFSYARTAFRLQADEYVLKTEISKETIGEIIQKYLAKHYEKSEPKQSLETQLSRTGLIQALIGKQIIPPQELAEKLNAAQIEAEDRALIVVAVSFPAASSVPDPTNMLIFNDTSLSNSTFCSVGKNTFLIITNFNEEYSSSEHAQYASWSMIDRIEKLFENCRIGISNTGAGYADLQACVQQSLQALNNTFYSSVPTKRYSAIQPREDAVHADFYDTIMAIRHKINDHDFAPARKSLEQLFVELQRAASLDTEVLKRSLYTLLEEHLAISDEYNKELHTYVFNAIEVIKSTHTFSQLQESFFAIFDHLVEEYQSMQTNEYIKDAKQYVRDNYATIASNTEIASVLHLNPEYFSRLFKRETGMNFNTYITRYRLTKAEKLLKTTTMTINEIAHSVGYENVNYFSYTYKKIMGSTPSEVRTRNDV